MQDHSLKTIDQLEAFLQGSEAVSFQLTSQAARLAHTTAPAGAVSLCDPRLPCQWSEFGNARVAALLQRLRVSFTRPRQSNDNALAEGKHASTMD